jgi:intraflagellar transport protein 122
VHCKQPFVFSYFSFEVLPVVEFAVAEDISPEEAQRLISDDSHIGGKVNTNGVLVGVVGFFVDWAL